MFIKTKGIVLHKTKYSDSDLIVKIYTEKAGTQSFILKHAFSKKTKVNQSLFGQLSLLELNFDLRKQSQLHYIRDVVVSHHYSLIPFDVVRGTVLFFYNELLYKLLFNAPEDENLFAFLENCLLELDDPNCRLADVHIRFMIRLAKILGLMPENNYSQKCPYFSVEDACFSDHYVENLTLEQPASDYLSQLLNHIEEGELVPLPDKSVRMNLLRGLVQYFETHNESVSNIQSLNILNEVLS